MNPERTEKLKKLIARLLDEAPKMEGVDPTTQNPAFECQILLKTGYRAVGSLGLSPEGLLRFMAVGKADDGSNRHVIAEHFFDYDDLAMVVAIRGNAEPPRIVTAGRG